MWHLRTLRTSIARALSWHNCLCMAIRFNLIFSPSSSSKSGLWPVTALTADEISFGNPVIVPRVRSGSLDRKRGTSIFAPRRSLCDEQLFETHYVGNSACPRRPYHPREATERRSRSPQPRPQPPSALTMGSMSSSSLLRWTEGSPICVRRGWHRYSALNFMLNEGGR